MSLSTETAPHRLGGNHFQLFAPTHGRRSSTGGPTAISIAEPLPTSTQLPPIVAGVAGATLPSDLHSSRNRLRAASPPRLSNWHV